MTRYLANAFSLSMIKVPSRVTLDIKELSAREFCIELYREEIVSAVGHQSTVDLVNKLCNTNFTTSRIMIRLEDWDELILVQLLTRLEEGKILSNKELEEMLSKGLIKFLKVTVISLVG
ncbi:MAG: DUF1874 domain-containing protein [Desulfurococcaceae archaeon]